MADPAPAAPWYADGLRFTCTRCGKCCTGSAGFTWVDDAEVLALARRLGLDEASFRRRYTRDVHRDGEVLTSLKEKRGGDCVFWQTGAGCTVYADRPRQCRTWPFWRRVVATPGSWRQESEDCPGMGQGELHPAGKITEIAADDGLPG